MDKKLFENIYETYFDKIVAFVSWRVGDKYQTEDLVSDIFFKIFNKLETLRSHEDSVIRSWVFKIARNTIYDFYRNKSRKYLSVDDICEIKSDDLSVEEVTERQLIFSDLVSLIHILSPQQSELLLLRFVAECDNGEIAKIMNISEKSVTANISRGLKVLCDMYREKTRT